eukprot:2192116-Amphidinium_carterae.1
MPQRSRHRMRSRLSRPLTPGPLEVMTSGWGGQLTRATRSSGKQVQPPLAKEKGLGAPALPPP